MLPLPLPFDAKFADRSKPSLTKVRELIGVDGSMNVEFVSAIPCLSQGSMADEWAFVVKDEAGNRYVLMSHGTRWYLSDVEELRKLTNLYATASQVAIRSLIELTEGQQQDEAKVRRDAAKSLNLTIGQEEIEVTPALEQAVDALVDAAESAIKKQKGRSDGQA